LENYLIDKKEVVKSNNLIESSYKLTATEQKIIYYGASLLNKTMIEKSLSISEVEERIRSAQFPLITFNACDFQRSFGINTGNAYALLHEASDRLYKRDFIYIDKDGKPIHKRWVITSKYDEENAKVQLQFHPDLIQDLLVFKDKFTIFKLKDTTDIKSGYAYRLYELCKQYERFKFRIFSVKDLRFKLGIEDTEYPLYGNLKQNVIMSSIKNINKYTDMELDFEETKDKRKVIKVKFLIKPKESLKVASSSQLSFLDTEDVRNSDLTFKLQEILKFDITAGQAQNFIAKAFESIEKYKLNIQPLDYIIEKKSVVDDYNSRVKVGNYIGSIIRAIENNWTNISINSAIVVDTFNNYPQRPFDYSMEDKLLGYDKNVEDEVAVDNE